MKVAVIGGGVSGLAAARRIRTLSSNSKKKNLQNVSVRIFEARNRLGGRVYTEHWSDHENDGKYKNEEEKKEKGHKFLEEENNGDFGVVEHGAAWVLGEINFSNPILDIIRSEGIEIYRTRQEDAATYAEILDPNDVKENKRTVATRVPKKFVKTSYADYSKQMALLDDFFWEQFHDDDDDYSEDSSIDSEDSTDESDKPCCGKGDISLKEGLQQMNFLSGKECKYPSDISKKSKPIPSQLRLRLSERLWKRQALDCAACLSSISLQSWLYSTDDQNGKEYQESLVLDGYSRVVENMSCGMVNDGCIEFGVVIREICAVNKGRWGVDLVIESVETGEVRTERFDAVICTVPLGCLRAHDIKFSPATDGLKERGFVPNEESAIKPRLEMGLLNRVVMKFESPFWQEQSSENDGGWIDNYDYIGWLAHETNKQTPSTPAEDSELKITTQDILEYVNLHNQCHATLAVELAGETAKKVELMSKEDAVEVCMKPLRKMYGSRCQEPKRTLVTRWGLDPFSRGSYSFSNVGSGPPEDSFGSLGGTVGDSEWGNRLLFAGEATCVYHAGTVRGAYESGEREADRLFAKF